MALTKVTGSVIKDSVSLSGNVSVGGTLTYQDVTNVDALGIGTFRTGIKVLAGQVDVGSNIKLGNAGVITATTLDINGDIDVDGHTNLDNVSIAGVSTFASNVIVNGGISNAQYLNLSALAPSIDFNDTNHNSDFMLQNANGLFKLYDNTNTADRVTVASNGNVSVKKDLDVDGHTNLDNVSVAGVTTFSGHVQANNIKLDRGSASDFALRIDTTSSTGACRVSFDESGTSKGQVAYSHDNDQVELIGRSGNGAAIITDATKTGFKVDTNGYVTKPLNPKFWAKSSNAQTLTSDGTNYIKNYENEIYDIGSCYDGTNKFTAPITGYYHFGWSFMLQGSNADTFTYLFGAPLISGNDIAQEVMSPRSGGATFVSLVGSHLLYLTSGQYVQIRMRQSGGSNVSVRADQSYFWGYLVG